MFWPKLMFTKAFKVFLIAHLITYALKGQLHKILALGFFPGILKILDLPFPHKFSLRLTPREHRHILQYSVNSFLIYKLK
jgi:hypothetical protein